MDEKLDHHATKLQNAFETKADSLAQRLEGQMQKQDQVMMQQTHMLEQHSGSLQRLEGINLLTMRGSFQPTTSSQSTKSEQNYKTNAYMRYEGNDDPAFITDTKTGKIAKDPKTGKDIPSNVTVTDMVTGKKMLKADAKAGHIYQKRWPNALLEQSGLIVHDPENIIITTKEAEAKLDKEDICLLPDEDGAAIRVKVLSPIMLNPKATQRFVSQDEGETDRMTWADFNGRAIKSAEGPLPAKRVCGAHSHFAIRENERRRPGIPKGSEEVPLAAFGSPSVKDSILYDLIEADKKLFGSKAKVVCEGLSLHAIPQAHIRHLPSRKAPSLLALGDSLPDRLIVAASKGKQRSNQDSARHSQQGTRSNSGAGGAGTAASGVASASQEPPQAQQDQCNGNFEHYAGQEEGFGGQEAGQGSGRTLAFRDEGTDRGADSVAGKGKQRSAQDSSQHSQPSIGSDSSVGLAGAAAGGVATAFQTATSLSAGQSLGKSSPMASPESKLKLMFNDTGAPVVLVKDDKTLWASSKDSKGAKLVTETIMEHSNSAQCGMSEQLSDMAISSGGRRGNIISLEFSRTGKVELLCNEQTQWSSYLTNGQDRPATPPPISPPQAAY